MNSDLIRLSDLVSECVRYYQITPQEAAYELHEVIESLYREYAVRRGKMLPENLFWVGRVRSCQRSSKGYEIDFGSLRKYFSDRVDSPENVNVLLNCFCRAENDYENVPAGVIYLSKAALAEWIAAAGIEPPGFILGVSVDGYSRGGDQGDELKTIELNNIGKIISGLIGLVKAVHNAHSEPSVNIEAKRRAENIIKAASRLNSDRKNFCPYPVILSLAEEAGIDMVKDFRTLERYAKGK